MIDITPLEQLGRAEHGWLSARFHFSFAEHFDPARMGFGPLRVWNDDLIRPGGGFPMHPHREFEIVTYIRAGAIAHEDSLGNSGVTRAGEVQVMSAGTGIVHSEFNGGAEDLRLFQIWLQPDTPGLAPRWETRRVHDDARGRGLTPLASGEAKFLDGEGRPRDGILRIHQDATLYAGEIAAGERVTHEFGGGRRAYLVPARGAVTVNGITAPERAGIAVAGEPELTITADQDSGEDAEVVLFDLP